MKTYTGRFVDPMNLTQGDIDIVDIAHHLSNMCRFNGASKFHYSVAQHSYLCSFLPCSCLELGAKKEHAKMKLLHDAEEALFTDIPRPIKQLPQFEFYRERADKARAFIFNSFGLPAAMTDCVHEADNMMLVREGIELMNTRYHQFGNPAPGPIEEWTPAQAKERFLSRFRQLFLE